MPARGNSEKKVRAFLGGPSKMEYVKGLGRVKFIIVKILCYVFWVVFIIFYFSRFQLFLDLFYHRDLKIRATAGHNGRAQW